MNAGMNLYFIAIIPPQEICDAVTTIKRDFAERFGSRHALKVIPHITLKAPFSFPADEHHRLLQWFRENPVTGEPFQQKLKDFGSFENKRNPVIFIEPELNDALKQLQSTIIQYFRRSFPFIQVPSNEFTFHPHMTVAYRDLGFENFQLAWDEYISKPFGASFIVDRFHLLQHDKKQWNSIAQSFLQ
jgi:2'-5' RNA ligase